MTEAELTRALSSVRQLLQSADKHTEGSFSEVEDAFLLLANRPDFMSIGEFRQDKALNERLHAYVRARTNNPKAQAQQLITVKIASQHLCHGAFQMSGLQGNYLWFSDIDQGLIVLHHKDGTRELSRLTAHATEPGEIPPNKVLRGVDGLH